MSISTNSVIHYTDRFEHLSGIISSQGFRLKYCHEQINIQAPGELDIAVAMVSFCDIPLSEVKNHIDTYGAYGIGLSKTWAKQVGMNPVLYIENNSNYATILRNQGARFNILINEKKSDPLLIDEYLSLFSYCKNYEGRLVRGKINSENYRFYDEREWRYVATDDKLNGAYSRIFGDSYLKDKQVYNDKIKECYLKFTHADISYIILDNDDEIPEILTLLNTTYESISTAKDLKILSTKILTKNQIWNDF